MFLPEVKSKANENISILLKIDNHSYNYICECGDASGLTVKECQSTASAKIAKICKVKTAIPVHFSRKYKEEKLAVLVEEFESAFKASTK